MSANLTDADLQQVWEMVWNQLKANGSDYTPKLIVPTTDEEWQKVKIICQDERVAGAAKACNIDLKAVFESYGVDVVSVKNSAKNVADAEGRVNLLEGRVNGVEERLTGVGGAEERITSIHTDVTALAEQVANDKTIVGIMKSDVERIYQDASEGSIFGVDFNMVTGEATRIDASVGLEFHRFIGGAGSTPIPVAKSFMNVSPWSGIYQTLRTVEGNNLVARSGDANFESALLSGGCNLFTCIPRYYIKMETPVVNGQAHWILHVSGKPFAGAFSVIEGDSVEIASIVTAEKNGKHVSQPGTVPKVVTHIYSFEAQATAQELYNSSWKDFLSWWILMLVQTASLNSQNTVAAGVSSGFPFSWGDANWSKIMESSNGATNSIVVRKQSFKKSMLIYIGTNYNNGSLGKRHVTDVQPHGSNSDWLIVSFDGDPIATTTDHWCTACAQDTSVEAVLAMGLDCGYYKPNAEFSEGNCHAFVYGICDPWGNIFQCPSGIAKQNHIVYVSSDRELCPKSFPATGWNQVEEFPFIGSDYPSEWRIKQTSNNITLIPTRMGGNSNMNFGDRTWDADDGAIRLPWRGGGWDYGAGGGACCFVWDTAGYQSVLYGGRLAYRKK